MVNFDRRALEDGHKWAAFFDIDEFLVLKKHRHVVDFLDEHCAEGAVIMNWYVFGTNKRTGYEPLPVTKRFQLYEPEELNFFVKSIVRLVDFEKMTTPHWAHLLNGTKSFDTSGKGFGYPRETLLHVGPTDVAIVNHYRYKSRSEYVRKRIRGLATMDCSKPRFNKRHCKPEVERAKTGPLPVGTIFDDTAWKLLKQNVPKYAKYEARDFVEWSTT